MEPTIDVIIVNWNSSASLERCLASLLRSSRPDFAFSRIVVVDNASDDGCAGVVSRFPVVKLFQNTSNRGFAAACNEGARNSVADYLLFLNPDTALRADTLVKVVGFMEQPDNVRVGICGIRLCDEQGRPGLCCARFPTLRSLLGEMSGLDRIAPTIFRSHHLTPQELKESREVDQIIGAFFTVRRTLFQALGGFDERFFLYFEEVDLSIRARSQGAISYFLSEAEAVHLGRISSKQTKALRLLHFVRSRLLYCRKHLGPLSFGTVLAFSLVIEPVARICWAAFGRSQSSLTEILSAYRKLCGVMVRSVWRRVGTDEQA